MDPCARGVGRPGGTDLSPRGHANPGPNAAPPEGGRRATQLRASIHGQDDLTEIFIGFHGLVRGHHLVERKHGVYDGLELS